MYHIKDARVKDWPKNQSIYNRCAAAVGEWITETKPPRRNSLLLLVPIRSQAWCNLIPVTF